MAKKDAAALLAKAKELLESLSTSSPYGHKFQHGFASALSSLESPVRAKSMRCPDCGTSNIEVCRAMACASRASGKERYNPIDNFPEAGQLLTDEPRHTTVEEDTALDLASAIREVVRLHDNQASTNRVSSIEASRYFGLYI